MSAPATTPPVCALCRKRPGVTRLPPSTLLLGERWRCDGDRCVRLATSGRKVYLADAAPAVVPPEMVTLTFDAEGSARAMEHFVEAFARRVADAAPVACDAFSAPAHNPGARVVATGGGR